MTAEIRTLVSQMNIVGGMWREGAPNQVAVREPKSADVPGVGKGDLFVLAEINGPVSNREAAEQQLAQVIQNGYYLARGAVTASLRRALQAANDQLYQRNQGFPRDKRITAGAVVVVMRGEEAFIAQIGSTSLFAVLNDMIRRYPTQTARPGQIQKTAHIGLGLDVLAEPNLHHLYIDPDDMLILADSRLSKQLSLDDVVKAVVIGNAKATIKSLARVAQTPDGSALVLAAVKAQTSTFAAIKRNAPTPLGRLFGGDKTQATSYQAATSAEVASVAANRDASDSDIESVLGKRSLLQKLSPWLGRFSQNRAALLEDIKDVSTSATSAGYQPTPRSPEVPSSSAYEFVDENDSPTRPQARSSAREMDSLAHDPGFHPHLNEVQGETTSTWGLAGQLLRWLGAGVLLLVALLGNGLKTILGLVLPGSNDHSPRRAGAQVYQQQVSPVSWKLLRNIVIAIPIVVGLIVAISYIQKGRLREAEYQEFLTNAQGKFQQAQAVAADPSAALGLMAEAETLLTEAEAIKGVQPEITILREEIRTTADRVSNVQRLTFLPQLRQYTDGGTALKNIDVQGVEVYVLDAGTDRIFHHQLDDSGTALLPDNESLLLTAREQQVDTVTVSELLGITWMPTGGNRQTSDLIILNSTGLLEFNPNWGITTSALASGELLASPVAVSSYFGNFYILDPQANRLLRYLPTADGYSAAPESYFSGDQAVNLNNAVDFAIDGAVYVLFSDGQIGKYQAGQRMEFNISGLVKPLTNPVAIFTAPEEEIQYVYVADAGNQRIVQLEKDGRFIRQFKPGPETATTFSNLQDIFVDEIGERLYILDSNSFYATNLPPIDSSTTTDTPDVSVPAEATTDNVGVEQ